jgi:hypothetical protein
MKASRQLLARKKPRYKSRAFTGAFVKKHKSFDLPVSLKPLSDQQ